MTYKLYCFYTNCMNFFSPIAFFMISIGFINPAAGLVFRVNAQEKEKSSYNEFTLLKLSL